MVQLIEEAVPEKRMNLSRIRFPNVSGKFGFSLFLGKKELFVGVAVSEVQMETVVRKRKTKVFVPGGSATFVKT